jgi:hypothetical protein
MHQGSGPIGRAPEHRMSCGSGSSSFLRGLRDATRHAVPCGPRGSNRKKSLADLPVWLGPRVPNAHVHVSKTPDVRAIIGLQDIRAGSTVNACKTCGYTTTVLLQCSPSTIDHSHGTATVPDDLTARSHAADECDMAGRQDWTYPRH